MIDEFDIGPVELVVLSFPETRPSPSTVEALKQVLANGYVTLLDLVYLAKDHDGSVSQIDVDEQLEDVGLGGLAFDAVALLNDDDLDVVRESMEPGTAAAVIVYEETWARSFAATVRQDGGEVALHVQVPRDAVLSAVQAATNATGA